MAEQAPARPSEAVNHCVKDEVDPRRKELQFVTHAWWRGCIETCCIPFTRDSVSVEPDGGLPRVGTRLDLRSTACKPASRITLRSSVHGGIGARP